MVRLVEGFTYCEIPECNKVWQSITSATFTEAQVHEDNRAEHLVLRQSAVQTNLSGAQDVDVLELTRAGIRPIALRQLPDRAILALAEAQETLREI